MPHPGLESVKRSEARGLPLFDLAAEPAAPPKPVGLYGGAPGFKGRSTSQEAAAAVQGKVAKLQAVVLAALQACGAEGSTTHELVEKLALIKDTVAPRITELHRAGKVKDSGARRFTPSGKRAIVWVAVTA